MAQTYERIYVVIPYAIKFGILEPYETTAFKSKEDALASAEAVWEGFAEDNNNFEADYDDWEITDNSDWELDDSTEELDIEYCAINSYTADEIHVQIKSINLVGREN